MKNARSVYPHWRFRGGGQRVVVCLGFRWPDREMLHDFVPIADGRLFSAMVAGRASLSREYGQVLWPKAGASIFFLFM